MNHDLFRNHDETLGNGAMSSNDITIDSRGKSKPKSVRSNNGAKYNSNSVGDFQDFEQHGSKLKDRDMRHRKD